MGATVSTIASGAIRKLFTVARELGIDEAELARGASFDRATMVDPDARIPHDVLYALWEQVLTRVPRSDLPLRGAEHYEPSDYGLVGFAVVNSATLAEAYTHTVRFLSLWTDDPSIRLQGDGTVLATYRLTLDDRPGRRCGAEATFAELLHAARLVTQTRLTPREVRFPHPAPADTSAHATFFGCDVRFGASDMAMVLDRSDLDRPLPKADPQLGVFLRKIADEALERRSGPLDSPTDRLRTLLAEELHKGIPPLDDLAKRLGTTERTIRRRLDEQGTSYRELLDETRSELARSYIRDRRMPLAEVAFMLGFTDPSAFHRAFKRWTGTTPKSFRDSS